MLLPLIPPILDAWESGSIKNRYGYILMRRRETMDSWMKEKGKYSEKDIKKLEKGSGCVKAWTLLCNWFYRVVSW
jgi:hypothetical protein